MIWSWLEIFFDERIGKASYLRFMEFIYIFSELTYFSFGAFHVMGCMVLEYGCLILFDSPKGYYGSVWIELIVAKN